MPRLQLLVATMNLTDIIGLCDKMHIASDALIINQSDLSLIHICRFSSASKNAIIQSVMNFLKQLYI